jgi:hypothetical protein
LHLLLGLGLQEVSHVHVWHEVRRLKAWSTQEIELWDICLGLLQLEVLNSAHVVLKLVHLHNLVELDCLLIWHPVQLVLIGVVAETHLGIIVAKLISGGVELVDAHVWM